jgi:L-rhamnose mutarotase
MTQPRRFGQIIRIKPECVEAYKNCHAAAWPAVIEQIKDCNIYDYSIYFDDQSHTLFATMKWNGTDFDADMERMKSNPEVRLWWEMTDSMQQTLVDGSTGSTDSKGWWKNLEEVFRCE